MSCYADASVYRTDPHHLNSGLVSYLDPLFISHHFISLLQVSFLLPFNLFLHPLFISLSQRRVLIL